MAEPVLLKDFDEIVQNSNSVPMMRELILQLAVQGRLVKQDPRDESASVLLEKIRKEKERMVKEGKIRKEKTLPAIKPEEKPYELPEGWEWVRVGDISNHLLGKMLLKSNPVGEYFPYLRAANIQWNWIDLTSINQMRFDKDELERYEVKKGDLLLCEGGEGGRCAIWEHDSLVMKYQNALHRLRPYGGISPKFILYHIWADSHTTKLSNYYTGMAIKHFTHKVLASYPFGLPPLAEQHRIVARVEELMALCDHLEAQQKAEKAKCLELNNSAIHHLVQSKDAKELTDNWTLIHDNFETLYGSVENVDKLQEAILQLAVQGRLVGQEPGDEPASVLLEEIKKEKERLVKEGKLKKEKPLPAIKPEEEPHKLPNGWAWIRLGDISTKIGSGSTPRGGRSVYVKEGVIFLRSQNVWNDGLKLGDVAFITEETHRKMNNTEVLANDILLNITGASLGRCTIVPTNAGSMNVSQHVTIIRPVLSEYRKYLHLCILSPFVQQMIWGRQVGMAREGLSKKVLELFEMPIPPLAEQHRIVARVEELLTLTNMLKEQIKASGSFREELMRACVEEVVGI